MAAAFVLVSVCILCGWVHRAAAYTSRAAPANKIKPQKPQKQTQGAIVTPAKDAKLQFDLGKFAFSLLPLSPESVGRRKTIFTEVVKNKVYTFEQVQGIINVNVPVRSTVICLKSGGLFVHNPVAPTEEAVDFIKSLESKHGRVKYITLASLALEHKGTSGAFSRRFPKADVYVQPGQYSFPIDLPTRLFYPFGTVVKDIPANSADAPWGDEIDHAVLGPLRPPGVGGFGDTAFFHRETSTLLVTDAVVRVDDEPPAIIQEDPRALLYHARDTQSEVVTDTPANRRKGWRRMVLFGLTFQPSGIDVKDTFEAIKALDQVTPEMKKLGEGAIPYDGGLYPWDWVADETPNFKALQGGLLVAPILQKLILNREPEKVLDWVDTVCQWPFKRIIPCHLANDIKAGPKDFRRAFDFLVAPPKPSFFAFLNGDGGGGKKAAPCPVGDPRDVRLLSDVSKQLTESGVLFPEAPLVKRRAMK